MQTIRATEREIVQRYDQLRAFIDSHKLELIRELNAIKDRRLKDIAVQKDEEERQFVMLESFKKYCEGLRDKGTACDISRAAIGLQSRAEELSELQKKQTGEQLGRVTL